MHSKLMNEAIKGDDIGLLQITWLFDNQALSENDMLYIINLSLNFDSLNIYQKYIVGLANFFGTPFFSQNKEKAATIMKLLAKDCSYAQTMLALIEKESTYLEDAALNKKNPLAILHYASAKIKNFGYGLFETKIASKVYLGFGFNAPPKPYQEKRRNCLVEKKDGTVTPDFEIYRAVHDKKNFLSALDALNFSHDFFPKFALAYKALSKTDYKSSADNIVKNFQSDLIGFYKLYVNNKYILLTADLDIHQTFLSFFGSAPLDYIAQFFLILSNYYEETAQRTLMFETLQYACEIDPKHKTKWSSKLRINTYKDAELYLFLTQPIVKKRELSSDEFVRRQTIERKNAEFIMTQIEGHISTVEKKQFSSLVNQYCKNYTSSDLAVTPEHQSSYRR